MLYLRGLAVAVAALGLAQTSAVLPEVDPDDPCRGLQRCEPGAPGPMPVVHARPGETVTFHCYAYSPCAELVVDDSGDGAKSYLMTIVASDLAGGFGVTAAGVRGVPREEWYMECAQDTWCLGGFGFGFGAGGPQKFAHQVPFGTASNWTFGFAPLSGQRGGDITLRIDLSDGEAPVPAWAPDGKRIPAD